jgi:hypothetical protein
MYNGKIKEGFDFYILLDVLLRLALLLLVVK